MSLAAFGFFGGISERIIRHTKCSERASVAARLVRMHRVQCDVGFFFNLKSLLVKFRETKD